MWLRKKYSYQTYIKVDRFIPYQNNIELSHFNLTHNTHYDENFSSQRKVEYRKQLQLALFGYKPSSNVLQFKQNENLTPETIQASIKNISYETAPICEKKENISKHTNPEIDIIINNIVNDYNINILDWSDQDIIAFASSSTVYLYAFLTGDIHFLYKFKHLTVSSLKWFTGGIYLSIG